MQKFKNMRSPTPGHIENNEIQLGFSCQAIGTSVKTNEPESSPAGLLSVFGIFFLFSQLKMLYFHIIPQNFTC